MATATAACASSSDVCASRRLSMAGAKGSTRRPSRALEPRSAKAAIGALLKFHGIADEVRARRVLTEWADLVGPRIASRTRPYGVNERTLVIEVASAAWMQELNL